METRNDLILIGKQGSGKGTQAKIIAEKLGYQIFETGGALRKIAQEDSDLGREVKEITSKGNLVSNELVMQIVEDFISKIASTVPVIFDGIPRSDEQRQSLEALLAKNSRDFQALEIKLSDEEAIARLSIRGKCNDCGANFGNAEDCCTECNSTNITRRADDQPEAIKNRLETYNKTTEPLLQKWDEAGKLVSIDGEQSVDQVTADILEKLEKVN